MSSEQIPIVRLNNGTGIPQIGLGLFGPDDKQAASVVVEALQCGYRLLDTAEQYNNERGVGEGIRNSNVAREEILVMTKLGNHQHGYDATLRGFEESLERLGLDYIDFYLIHWPMTKLGLYVESWRALESLASDGRARTIGVANFKKPHLERLLAETDTVPAVNQIELHPGYQEAELRDYNEAHSIATMAWSPLGGNPFGTVRVLDSEVINGLAERHGKTNAQVVIRWHIQKGNVIIPKTTRRERMRENLEVFDFALSDGDMAAIDSLETGIPNPYDPDLMEA